MRVGVPREVKVDEYRVALTPAGADALVDAGHTVVVEAAAGDGAGFDDDAYRAVGATIADAAEAWGADLVLKVKEPQVVGVRADARRPYAVHVPAPGRRTRGRRAPCRPPAPPPSPTRRSRTPRAGCRCSRR